MKQRVIGFVLLAVAIVGGLAAFAVSEDYIPQLGFVRATQRAYVWTNCTPSPPPPPPPRDPAGGVGDLGAYASYASGKCSERARGQHFTLTLATALVISTAVGLTGLGLVVLGKDGQP